MGWRNHPDGALDESEALATLRPEERLPHVHLSTHFKYSYHARPLATPCVSWPCVNWPPRVRGRALQQHLLQQHQLQQHEALSVAEVIEHLQPGLCHAAYATTGAPLAQRAPLREWEAFCSRQLSQLPDTLHEELFTFQVSSMRAHGGTEVSCTAYDCAALQARHYVQSRCARALLDLPLLGAFDASPLGYRTALLNGSYL